jgi:hypothetical protein
MPCDSGTLKKTSTGLVFEQCIDCLLTSTHVSGSRTDLQALLCMCSVHLGCASRLTGCPR